MTIETGSQFGRYEILGPLGAGGMGEVYRAKDTRLGREVAIKVIREALAEQASLERFESEARSISALNHPHVVTLYDIGQEGERPYLVMELVEGRPLRQDLGQPLPVGRAVELAAQIADALAAAHRKGIVHRDLKPENILIDAHDQAKVLDFGLAQWVAPAGDVGGSIAETTTRLTDPGSVLGTIGYLSPEMAAGRETDAPADQFSFGCILYEMLAGAPPFAGASAAEVLAAVLRDQPRSLGEVRSDLPPPLTALIERCLAKAPESRFPGLERLRDELQQIAAALAAPTAPRARSGGSLPARRNRFFGRDRELEEIRKLVLDSAVRLVTLSGAGGTGKTRLALEAADSLVAELDGRVFFVPLAGISEDDLVGPEIGRVIGAEMAGPRTPAEAIGDAVEELGGPVLVVLDNFEHLGEAALLVGELLEAASELTFLVTSRELLRVYGEHAYPVQPLEVPSPARSLPPEELALQPAVALFVDRAQAAQTSFRLDSDNAPAVAELCARLDGLPLALELAAARVRLLSPRDLVARLGRRLEVLTGGARDVPDRQRTLRNTIEWSHNLLDQDEQAAFRRLAVFAGGFTLEGAEAVVDPYGDLSLGVSEAVGSLADKSLIQQASSEEPRFFLLETVREYALERLKAAGDGDETRRAHAAYFLVLAEEGAAAFAKGEDSLWLAIYAREHDNLLAALDWLTGVDNAEWALRTALGVFPFWERSELLAAGLRRLLTATELPSAAAHDGLRAKALLAAAALCSSLNDPEQAVELSQASLELTRKLDDTWGVLLALNGLALHLASLERFDEARSYQAQALEVGAELGDNAFFARALSNMARIELGRSEHDEARRLYREAGAIFSRLGDRPGWAWSLNHEGDVARDQGELAAAVELYEQALIVFHELDDSWGIGSSLGDLGLVRRLEGNWEEATDLYKRALRCFAGLGHRRGVARVLENLAIVAADAERGEVALRLAGAAAAIRDRLGLRDDVHEEEQALARRLARLTDMLGEAAGKARREGEAMPWRDAVEYALHAMG